MKLSWSSISSFDPKWGYGSPEKWYRKYILKEQDRVTPELEFGKKVADSFQTDTPLAPVTLYKDVEHKLEVKFGDIDLVGYLDTYDPVTHSFREFKTAKNHWTKQKAQNHGQLKMYALLLYLKYKVKPEDYTIHLDYMLTRETDDFKIDFVHPITVYSHQVKLTFTDVFMFGKYIKKVHKEMVKLSTSKLASNSPHVIVTEEVDTITH